MLQDASGKDTTTPDPADVERYKLEAKTYHDRKVSLEENLKRVFALVLGQCSQTIRDRVEASSEWKKANSESDTIALLKLIQKSLYNQATGKQFIHAQIEAELALHKFIQGRNMSNSDYLDKFKGLVEVYKHLGGKPGVNDMNVAAVKLTDSTLSNEQAEKIAEDWYLGILLLLKSDRRREIWKRNTNDSSPRQDS